MSCPTITQYLETLQYVEGLFRTLGGLEPRRDLYGEPRFWVGNFSVIFRIAYRGHDYALKCYTREPHHDPLLFEFLAGEGRPYVVPARWMPREVYVYDERDQGRYQSAMLMEWIEGETLGRRVARLCQHGDKEQLRQLAGRFDRLALWLLGQEFAHGDIKHDNVLVTPQGQLCLIDFDGMFLPALAGRRTSLIGSPAYQHPARDEHYFNEHIDDYPLAVISLSLHILADDPGLFERYNDQENLIFNAADLARGASALLSGWMEYWEARDERTLLELAKMMRSETPELKGLGRVFEALCEQAAPETQPLFVSAALGRMPASEPLPEPEALREETPPVIYPLEEPLRAVAEPEGTYEVVDPGQERCAVVRRGGRYGYADLRNGTLLCEPVYEEAAPFSESLAAVRRDGRPGFIDLQGRLVIDAGEYDGADSFREGLARVQRGQRYGFIDRQGVEVIPVTHDFVTAFREGLAVARRGEKYGYIDPRGQWAIPPVYDAARPFHSGEAQVSQDGRTFLIDRQGRVGEAVAVTAELTNV